MSSTERKKNAKSGSCARSATPNASTEREKRAKGGPCARSAATNAGTEREKKAKSDSCAHSTATNASTEREKRAKNGSCTNSTATNAGTEREIGVVLSHESGVDIEFSSDAAISAATILAHEAGMPNADNKGKNARDNKRNVATGKNASNNKRNEKTGKNAGDNVSAPYSHLAKYRMISPGNEADSAKS